MPLTTRRAMTDKDWTVVLSELFRQDVRGDVTTRSDFSPNDAASGDGGEAVVCNMQYVWGERTSTASRQSVRQTAFAYRLPAWDLPQFHVRVRSQRLAWFLGDPASGLVFPDDPQFSQTYSTEAWKLDAVKVLLHSELRRLLVQELWSICGAGPYVVIYRYDETTPADQLKQAGAAADRALAALHSGLIQLDASDDLPRATTSADLTAAMDRLEGGLFNSVAERVQRVATPLDEMQRFRQQPPPRIAPPGVRAQVIGQNLTLLVLGLVLSVAGAGGGAAVAALAGPGLRWLALAFAPLLVGGLILSWRILRLRRQRRRLLQHGAMGVGRISRVRRTSWEINGERQFLATLEFDWKGQPRQTTTAVFGNLVDLASYISLTNREVALCVDPDDPSSAICLDLIYVRQ